MKMLLINTAAEPGYIAVTSGMRLARRDLGDRMELAEKLLPNIDELLRDAGQTLPEIDKIAVCTGPGPFTALRIGIATANALAFSEGIPMVGLDATLMAEPHQASVEAAAVTETQLQVIPNYGGKAVK